MQFECELEGEVFAAVAEGRWPEGLDPALREHIASCAICSDVVGVAVPMQGERLALRAAAVVPEAQDRSLVEELSFGLGERRRRRRVGRLPWLRWWPSDARWGCWVRVSGRRRTGFRLLSSGGNPVCRRWGRDVSCLL